MMTVGLLPNRPVVAACYAATLMLGVLAPLAAHGQPANGKKYALLVGINEYRLRRLNQPEPLKYAERDVSELANVLRAGGYNVTLSLGSGSGAAKATRANIVAARDALLARVTERDLVLIAMSGHGVQRETKGDDGKLREVPFYCPYDANTIGDTALLDPASLVDLNELIRLLNEKGGRNNLLLVDACRDDSSKPKGGKSFDGSMVENLAAGNAILFASSTGRRAFESDKAGGGHGIFFHAVIEGMNGAAADGQGRVTWDLLVNHVRGNVDDHVRDWIGPDFEQRPHGVANLTGRSPVLLDRSNSVPKKPPKAKSPALLVAPFGKNEADDARTAWAKFLKAPEERSTTLSAAGVEMLLIPPGEFRMGSSETAWRAALNELKRTSTAEVSDFWFELEKQANTTIAAPFYAGRFEITRGQFRRFVNDTGYQTDPERDGVGGFGIFRQKDGSSSLGIKKEFTWDNFGDNSVAPQSDDHPVVNVSWNDAAAFCEWLTKVDRRGGRIRPTQSYSLLTEAQWEYCCRAGSAAAYSFGDDSGQLHRYGNIADAAQKAAGWTLVYGHHSAGNDGYIFAAPVGRFRANNFGLYDMHGNVSEWCNDFYGSNLPGGRDPTGPSAGVNRTARGGGWLDPAIYARAANRSGVPPETRMGTWGFRIALSCPAE